MLRRFLSSYLRVTFPVVIVAVGMILFVAFIFAQMEKNRQTADAYHHFRAALHSGMVYAEDGSTDLSRAFANADITFRCGSDFNNLEDFPPHLSAIDTCEAGNLEVTLPIFDYMWSSIYGGHSVSVWDNNGELISVVPESERSDLLALESELRRAAAETGVLSDKPVPGHFVYQIDPGGPIFPNSDNLPIVYAVPIRNAAKTQVIGAAYLIAEPPQLGMWPIAALLLLFLLPIVLVAGGFFSFFYSRRIKRRVGDLQTVVNRWSNGDFTPRLTGQRHDEIGHVELRLNQMADQLAELFQAKTVLAEVESRQKLARDLHDAAKQQLFAATMQLRAVNSLMDDKPDQARAHLNNATNLTKQAQQELAAVISELRPPQLREFDFRAAIEQLVDNFVHLHQIPVKLALDLRQRHAAEKEQALFRVIQEALSNIARHSHATAASIHMRADAAEMTLEIQDDGVGFVNEQMHTGFGLQSIAQRVEALGGNLSINSRPTHGTAISIVI